MSHFKEYIISVALFFTLAICLVGCTLHNDEKSEVSLITDSTETDISETTEKSTDLPETTSDGISAETSTETSTENLTQIEEQNVNAEGNMQDENTLTTTDTETTESVSGNIKSTQDNSIFVEIDDGSGDYPIYEFNVENASTSVGGVTGTGINNLKSGLNVDIQYYVKNNINFAVAISSDGEEYMPPSVVDEQNRLYGSNYVIDDNENTDSELSETDEELVNSADLSESI